MNSDGYCYFTQAPPFIFPIFFSKPLKVRGGWMVSWQIPTCRCSTFSSKKKKLENWMIDFFSEIFTRKIHPEKCHHTRCCIIIHWPFNRTRVAYGCKARHPLAKVGNTDGGRVKGAPQMSCFLCASWHRVIWDGSEKVCAEES